jgi:hypothetical protein
MGVLSRHKSLFFDLSSSSVIANDKIYYATSAILFFVFILVAAGSSTMGQCGHKSRLLPNSPKLLDFAVQVVIESGRC